MSIQWTGAANRAATRVPIKSLRSRINLAAMLVQFDVGAEPNAIRDEAWRIFSKNMESILEGFYDFLLGIPECRKILDGHDVPMLKKYQSHYWKDLFTRNLDQEFIDRSLIVGFTHHRIGLVPHRYIGGYAFLLSLLTDHLLAEVPAKDVQVMLKEVTAILHFDMSVSLTGYFFKGLHGSET